MGIPLYREDTVRSGECIDCFHCMEICPRNNISANPAPSVAALITVGALTGLYYVGTLSADSGALQASGSSQTVLSESQSSSKSGQYADGVYTGSAQGFRGDTEVSVTVESGAITGIKVLSYKDDQEFFTKAKNTIIANILKLQSADVDTVSGATFSSKGLIDAVADALSSAGLNAQNGGESDTQTSTDDSTSSTSAGETGGSSSSKLSVADGVYSGSGTGFRGTTSVSVTVSGGAITAVAIESHQDDDQFFSRAENKIISEILSAQSVDVDTVSGATFSSNGILEAVADALSLDFTNPNSASQGGGPGGHGPQRG